MADEGYSPVYFRNATAYGVSRRLKTGQQLQDRGLLTDDLRRRMTARLSSR